MNLLKFLSCMIPIFYKPDCSIHPYNPDTHFDAAQIVKIHGYPSEVHLVITKDGYILKLHRIHGSRDGSQNGQPVLLFHGLMGSSSEWLINGNSSLGFLLADQGYDVWMANARGNIYSAAHVSIPVQNPAFWDFSWHEMGMYDVPASIDYIFKITGEQRKVIYIGHSMGSTAALVAASSVPKLNKKIAHIIAFAPIAITGDIKGFNSYGPTLIIPIIRHILKVFPDLRGFDGDNVVRQIIKVAALMSNCHSDADPIMCWFLREMVATENVDIYPMIAGRIPAGTSFKTFDHFSQVVKQKNKFQEYQYILANSTDESPSQLYDLTRIKIPIKIIYSAFDPNTPASGIRYLVKYLKLATLHEINAKYRFTHTDFVYGKFAYEYAYQEVFKLLDRIVNKKIK